MFTKEQTENLLSKFLVEKNGLHTVLEMVLSSMMLSERTAFLQENTENKGNGYRPFRAFGQGHEFELRIPRDRLSRFTLNHHLNIHPSHNLNPKPCVM